MTLVRSELLDTRRLDAELAAQTQAPAAAVVPLFRAALGAGRERLKRAYLDGAAPQPLLAAHAWLVDELLLRAWRFHARLLPRGLQPALAAVGGYGRGELYPASDVDLLILLPKGAEAVAAPFVQALVSFAWDIGLEIGHAVRTLRDCVREARKDITVVTNLMEARHLAGDTALFEAMRTATGPRRLWPSRRFFAAKLAEQLERHRRYDDTAYNLEPNLKEGPGGLRDIQVIGWVAQRHFGAAELRGLVRHGFLQEREYRALARGHDLLARLRSGLHHLAGHREDRLLFDHQRALARQFGYRDRPGSLAVEQLMKRYYRTVKELRLLNEILLQHFQEEILGRGRARVKPLDRRFQSHNGFLRARHARIFERHPFALLELFHLLQRHPELKGVRADTIRLVRANLHRVNARFRRDLAARTLFMEILRAARGVTHELRRMNAYGVLGRYLPAFGRIVGQMQHDLFHVYTVDAHSLMVLRNIRRFGVRGLHHEFPLASQIMDGLVKPERLYLAALFHDIAKGRGGDHSELGAHDAEVFCRQHLLSEYDTRFVSWLVRHHLLMSHTAQRQDIYDPDVVREFARKVGDQEHLDHLYLLTVADMRGTSPTVWNAWRGRLLSQLWSDASRWLARGVAEPIDLEAHVADLRAEARQRLGTAVPAERVQHFWQQLDAEYFLRHDAESLAWQTRAIAAAANVELPIVSARYSPELGGSEFLFYTPDREGLFAVITGGFDRLNLSIMEARVHTLRNGFALDSFVALDHAGQPVSEPRALERLAQELRKQLLAPQPGRDLATAQLPRPLKHFPIETRVAFTPAPGRPLTIMEVAAQDRPGLLYQVALALQCCRVNLVTAKISTYGERAEDIFFVNTRDGQPLADPAQLACLEAEIRRRLTLAPAAAPAAGVEF